eukprot:scaffold299698_cov32-Tisochrysis_lutea.AAC.1
MLVIWIALPRAMAGVRACSTSAPSSPLCGATPPRPNACPQSCPRTAGDQATGGARGTQQARHPSRPPADQSKEHRSADASHRGAPASQPARFPTRPRSRLVAYTRRRAQPHRRPSPREGAKRRRVGWGRVRP